MKLLRHFWNFFVPHKGNDHKPHLFREEGIAFLLVVIMIATAFSFSGKLATNTSSSAANNGHTFFSAARIPALSLSRHT